MAWGGCDTHAHTPRGLARGSSPLWSMFPSVSSKGGQTGSMYTRRVEGAAAAPASEGASGLGGPLTEDRHALKRRGVHALIRRRKTAPLSDKGAHGPSSEGAACLVIANSVHDDSRAAPQ
eukprot:156824-Prymnesium_polylepis.1